MAVGKAVSPQALNGSLLRRRGGLRNSRPRARKRLQQDTDNLVLLI